MDYIVVSAKIPKELRKKMRQYGIKPSIVIREAIYREVKKIEAEKIKEEIKSLKNTLKKLSSEEVIKSIREDRER